MAANSVQRPPLAIVSDTDRGGVLLIFNTIGLVVGLVSVGFRVFLSASAGTGFVVFKDDVLCYAALVLCIIETALVWTVVPLGLGKKINLVSPNALVKVEEFQYVMDLLYIIGLFCSKASVLLLIERLQKAPSNKVWRSGLAVMTAWMVASVFMTALKCNLAHPWIQYNVHCTTLLARWDVIEITGILIEVGLFAGVIYLVYNIQMPSKQKSKVLLLFATRIIVVIFAILRLTKLPNYLHSNDPTYNGITAAIYAQIALQASLVTCTTPLLKPFLVEFNTFYGTLNRQAINFSLAYRGQTPEPHARIHTPAGTRSASHSEKAATTTPPQQQQQQQQSTNAIANGIGLPRSDHEPWTLRHDCAHSKADISNPKPSSASGSVGGGGIEVQHSYNVHVQPSQDQQHDEDTISRASSQSASFKTY